MNYLKKIVIIHWKRVFATFLLVISIGGIGLIKGLVLENVIQTSVNNNEPFQTYFEPDTPIKGSIEEIYQDVFMTQLLPYIQDAVSNYYEENTGYSPKVDPWEPDVLYIKRPNGYRTFLFEMKLKVAPYLGSHVSIGVDHITLRVSSREVEVINYEHIKDFPVPPWLQKNTLSLTENNWVLNCKFNKLILQGNIDDFRHHKKDFRWSSL